MSPVFYLLPRSPGEEPEPRGSICSSILSVCTFLPCAVQSQILLSLHVPALSVPILSHAETAISVDHWILWSKVLETGMLVDCAFEGRFSMIDNILKSSLVQARTNILLSNPK